MARPKKVKQDEVVTIVDDKNTEALRRRKSSRQG